MHFSDRATLVCSCYPPLWTLREASTRRKTRNQFIPMRNDILEEEEHIAEERARADMRLARAGLRRSLRELPTLVPVVTCVPSATVRQAIETMQRASIGCLLFIDQSRLLGIFTEQDVLCHVAAREVDLDRLQVRDLMRPAPACLHLDDELVYALHQMSIGGDRYIPLLDDQGRPAAVVSGWDMVEYLVTWFAQDVLNLPPIPPLDIAQDRAGA
jgi:CBS domain-containing protein